MSNKDYYNILNINKSADEKTIKKAYKRLAFKYHPDHNQGNKAYEEKFKEITAAYEVLIDPKKRAMYDKYGNTSFDKNFSESDQSNFNFFNDNEELFDSIFGFGNIFKNRKQQRYAPKKGANIFYIVELSLEEAIKGVEKNINILFRQLCNICNGIMKVKKCTKCNGKGTLQFRKGLYWIRKMCEMCHGGGQIIKKNQCKYCTDGYVRKNKNLSVRFHAGIENNYKMKLAGEGDESIVGGKNGDLLITIRIKNHPFFQRQKNDLYCEIPITFITAALGGEIEIPTFINTIKLKIPSETQTNKIFRIKGQGIQNNYIRGDIYCKLIVEIPINLNNKQKKLLKELENTFSNGKNFNKIQKFLKDTKNL